MNSFRYCDLVPQQSHFQSRSFVSSCPREVNQQKHFQAACSTPHASEWQKQPHSKCFRNSTFSDWLSDLTWNSSGLLSAVYTSEGMRRANAPGQFIDGAVVRSAFNISRTQRRGLFNVSIGRRQVNRLVAQLWWWTPWPSSDVTGLHRMFRSAY
jgi:hypothetical protein